MSNPQPADHYAPLRWLCKQLHEGKTLQDLVRQHRYKRKRPAATPAVKTLESPRECGARIETAVTKTLEGQ